MGTNVEKLGFWQRLRQVGEAVGLVSKQTDPAEAARLANLRKQEQKAATTFQFKQEDITPENTAPQATQAENPDAKDINPEDGVVAKMATATLGKAVPIPKGPNERIALQRATKSTPGSKDLLGMLGEPFIAGLTQARIAALEKKNGGKKLSDAERLDVATQIAAEAAEELNLFKDDGNPSIVALATAANLADETEATATPEIKEQVTGQIAKDLHDLGVNASEAQVAEAIAATMGEASTSARDYYSAAQEFYSNVIQHEGETAFANVGISLSNSGSEPTAVASGEPRGTEESIKGEPSPEAQGTATTAVVSEFGGQEQAGSVLSSEQEATAQPTTVAQNPPDGSDDIVASTANPGELTVPAELTSTGEKPQVEPVGYYTSDADKNPDSRPNKRDYIGKIKQSNGPLDLNGSHMESGTPDRLNGVIAKEVNPYSGRNTRSSKAYWADTKTLQGKRNTLEATIRDLNEQAQRQGGKLHGEDKTALETAQQKLETVQNQLTELKGTTPQDHFRKALTERYTGTEGFTYGKKIDSDGATVPITAQEYGQRKLAETEAELKALGPEITEAAKKYETEGMTPDKALAKAQGENKEFTRLSGVARDIQSTRDADGNIGGTGTGILYTMAHEDPELTRKNTTQENVLSAEITVANRHHRAPNLTEAEKQDAYERDVAFTADQIAYEYVKQYSDSPDGLSTVGQQAAFEKARAAIKANTTMNPDTGNAVIQWHQLFADGSETQKAINEALKDKTALGKTVKLGEFDVEGGKEGETELKLASPYEINQYIIKKNGWKEGPPDDDGSPTIVNEDGSTIRFSDLPEKMQGEFVLVQKPQPLDEEQMNENLTALKGQGWDLIKTKNKAHNSHKKVAVSQEIELKHPMTQESQQEQFIGQKFINPHYDPENASDGDRKAVEILMENGVTFSKDGKKVTLKISPETMRKAETHAIGMGNVKELLTNNLEVNTNKDAPPVDRSIAFFARGESITISADPKELDKLTPEQVALEITRRSLQGITAGDPGYLFRGNGLEMKGDRPEKQYELDIYNALRPLVEQAMNDKKSYTEDPKTGTKTLTITNIFKNTDLQKLTNYSEWNFEEKSKHVPLTELTNFDTRRSNAEEQHMKKGEISRRVLAGKKLTNEYDIERYMQEAMVGLADGDLVIEGEHLALNKDSVPRLNEIIKEAAGLAVQAMPKEDFELKGDHYYKEDPGQSREMYKQKLVTRMQNQMEAEKQRRNDSFTVDVAINQLNDLQDQLRGIEDYYGLSVGQVRAVERIERRKLTSKGVQDAIEKAQEKFNAAEKALAEARKTKEDKKSIDRKKIALRQARINLDQHKQDLEDVQLAAKVKEKGKGMEVSEDAVKERNEILAKIDKLEQKIMARFSLANEKVVRWYDAALAETNIVNSAVYKKYRGKFNHQNPADIRQAWAAMEEVKDELLRLAIDKGTAKEYGFVNPDGTINHGSLYQATDIIVTQFWDKESYQHFRAQQASEHAQQLARLQMQNASLATGSDGKRYYDGYEIKEPPKGKTWAHALSDGKIEQWSQDPEEAQEQYQTLKAQMSERGAKIKIEMESIQARIAEMSKKPGQVDEIYELQQRGIALQTELSGIVANFANLEYELGTALGYFNPQQVSQVSMANGGVQHQNGGRPPAPGVAQTLQMIEDWGLNRPRTM